MELGCSDDTESLVSHLRAASVICTPSSFPSCERIRSNTFAASVAHLQRMRIRAPYFQKRNGNGAQASARNAGTELAQWMPRLSYIYVVNNGKPAPNRDRITLLAAMTDAA